MLSHFVLHFLIPESHLHTLSHPSHTSQTPHTPLSYPSHTSHTPLTYLSHPSHTSHTPLTPLSHPSHTFHTSPLPRCYWFRPRYRRNRPALHHHPPNLHLLLILCGTLGEVQYRHLVPAMDVRHCSAGKYILGTSEVQG